jgi:hypothetical protein
MTKRFASLHERVFSCTVVFLGVAGLAACFADRTPTSTAQRPGVGAALQSEAGATRRFRTIDDENEDFVGQVPGFGGVYVDENGVLTMWLKDTSLVSLARQRIARFLTRGPGASAARKARAQVEAATMRVRLGNYDFRELGTMYRSMVAGGVAGSADVTVMDIDERTNRILVGVRSADRVPSVLSTVASLGVPDNATEVVEIRASLPESGNGFSPHAAAAALPSTSLSAQVRPVVGGLKIEAFVAPNSIYPCAIAYNLVALIGGVPGSDRFAVTNSHCAPPRSSVSGVLGMGQTVWSVQVATEILDPAFFTSSESSSCPAGNQCRFSDAAVFKYTDTSNANHGHVALPALGQTTYTDLVTVTDVYGPEVGRSVQKVGPVTGRTSGTVTNACASESVPGTPFYIICQGVATYGSSLNDSGSPVFEAFGDGTAWAVGIHHGSSGRFSRMYAALDEMYTDSAALGYLIPTTTVPDPPPPPPPPPIATIIGPTQVLENATCTWSATISGGTGPFSYYWTFEGAEIGTQSAQSSVTTSLPQSGALRLQVWDAYGSWDDHTRFVQISEFAASC